MQRSLAAGASMQEASVAGAERGKRRGAGDEARGQTLRTSLPKGGVWVIIRVRWEATGEV